VPHRENAAAVTALASSWLDTATAG